MGNKQSEKKSAAGQSHIYAETAASDSSPAGEVYFSAISELTPDLIFSYNSQGELLFSNPAGKKVLAEEQSQFSNPVFGKKIFTAVIENRNYEQIIEAGGSAYRISGVMAGSETAVLVYGRETSHDISLNAKLNRSNQLLELLTNAQKEFVIKDRGKAGFDLLLNGLLKVTESEYGFIGEVFYKADGSPYLKSHSITNIAWNQETRDFYDQHAAQGMEFHNLNTLFGSVMVTGDIVIANNPYQDPRRGGLPHGHPALNAFLGVPMFRDDLMIGMYGIANRPGGYNNEIIEFLKPFTATCSQLILAYQAIQQKKKAEDELRESEVKYRNIVETAQEGICTINPEGILSYVNERLAVMLGYTVAEMTGAPLSQFLDNEIKSEAEKYFPVKNNTLPEKIEIKLLRKDGSNIYVSVSAGQIHNEKGKVISVLGMISDITEKKISEEALRKERAFLDQIIERSPEPTAILDYDDKILRVNERFREFFGYTSEEIEGRQINSVIVPAHLRDQAEEYTMQATSGNSINADTIRMKKDGSLIDVELSAAPVVLEGRQVGIIAIYKNITERKRIVTELIESKEKVEQELLLSQARREGMFQMALDAIITVDKKGDIVDFNPAAERIFGYTQQEVTGRELSQFIVPAEYREAHRKGMERYMSTGEAHVLNKRIEMTAMRSDGSEFPAELAITAIGTREDPLFTAYIRDITESKRIRQAMQENLEKEKALSQLKSRFIATTSHEFRTPLTSIYSSSELLEHYGENWPAEKKKYHLKKMQRLVAHLKGMLNDVLLIERVESGNVHFDPFPLNIAEYCNDLIEEFEHNKLETVSLQQEISCLRQEYLVDEKLFGQIIRNLLSNAFKYSPDGGTVKFSLKADDRSIDISVADQGIGISEQDIPHLFERFFRGENTSGIEGTGLGLPIVKNAVDMHGGTIHVASTVGHGSVFTVTLPARNK